MGYSFLEQGANNLKSLGFGAALPEDRDRLLNMVKGDPSGATADEKRKKLELQQQAGARGIQMKKGGKVKAKVSSASKRADGCCTKGKTKGRMV